jgi:hypothetical protein
MKKRRLLLNMVNLVRLKTFNLIWILVENTVFPEIDYEAEKRIYTH